MIGAWRADDVYEPSVIETVLPARPELLNDAGRAIGCVPEEIDAGGLYCALAKYEHYLRHECRPFDGDALGPDFNWGIELRRQGYKNYVDYSVAVEHCKPDGTSIHRRSTNPVQMRFVREGSSWSGKVIEG